jgi:hypothetical protein
MGPGGPPMGKVFCQTACFVLLGAAFAAVAAADELPRVKSAYGVVDAPAKPGPPVRRVYVLHSGVHTIFAHPNKNIFAETMRDGLKKRGIPERDIVVLETPYPLAAWYNPFPSECVTMFMASARCDSRVSRDAYFRMDRALKMHDVSEDDELIWIGHSAGGQMGLTMARLGADHARFHGLAKTTQPYRFDMVVTLGSPIASHEVPPEVKVRHYLSPRDGVPRRLMRISPPLLWVMGYNQSIKIVPEELPANCKIRLFRDVEHPNWDVEERVLDRILAESRPHYCPCWQHGLFLPSVRLAPLGLMCRFLDEYCHVTIEDPPRPHR